MRDDRQLLQQLRRGDPAGLRHIYEKYKDRLLTVAVCLLADAAAAEDVLHDVFVSFAAGAKSMNIRGNLKSYLAACVANRARDQLRSRNRRNLMPLQDAVESTANTAEPLVELIDREEARLVCRALMELPYEQREVITLHLHGVMTFKQIARQLNISVNTAKSRYRYGLDKMRSLLQEGVRT